MAVAWEQFLWSLFLLANKAYEQVEYGSGPAAGHRVAYAVLVYLVSSGGATILHYLPWHEPAHIFVEVFGHVAGFAFKTVGKALVVLYIPCSMTYPYALLTIAVSAMAMAILAAFRLLLRFPKGLQHLLAHLDVDAFALLCAWILNDAFRSMITGGKKIDNADAALYLWPYMYASLVVVTHAMMAAEAIPVHKIANCHLRTFVESLLELSDRGLTLQLGWTILPSMGVLNFWLFGGVSDPVLFGFLSALMVSLWGLVCIALWNWQADTCKLERHPHLEDLLSSNPKLTWPPLLSSSWDKRPDYVSVGAAEAQLTEPGSFLVCNTYPCSGGPATLAVRVKDEKQKETVAHRIWGLFSFAVLHRKIPLMAKPRSLRDFGLMRARGGAWVLTERLEGYKEAAISRLSWGFAIGITWEIFFANAMYKAVDLPLPSEPKFHYCKSSSSAYSSDDYSSPKRLLLGAGDKEAGTSLAIQMLVQLGIAVVSTLVLGGIMWWHAAKYEGHGHGHGDDHDTADDSREEAKGKEGTEMSAAIRSKSANSSGPLVAAVSSASASEIA